MAAASAREEVTGVVEARSGRGRRRREGRGGEDGAPGYIAVVDGRRARVHMWEVGGGGLVVVLVEVRCGAVRWGRCERRRGVRQNAGAEIGVVGGGWCGRETRSAWSGWVLMSR
jgi:hypothetical protein